MVVPCVDGAERRYVGLDAAASTSALPAVADAVDASCPCYSSVHRAPATSHGARPKPTRRHVPPPWRSARGAPAPELGSRRSGDIAVLCRNTTEALNHLAYRLRLAPDDVVLTTVVEHHANLLPWGRVARRRYVECGTDGTFGVDDVVAASTHGPRPRLLAVTGASNVTGWLPPIDDHRRRPPTSVACRWSSTPPSWPRTGRSRPAPTTWPSAGTSCTPPTVPACSSGPGPRSSTATRSWPAAVPSTSSTSTRWCWTEPPDTEEAGSPNVVGAVALRRRPAASSGASAGRPSRRTSGPWPAGSAHGLAAIDGVRLLGPRTRDRDTLAIATFAVDGVHHALVAARLSAEWGIGVRHGCFCAHPYLIRLLGLVGRRRSTPTATRSSTVTTEPMPGAVRASCGISTTAHDVDALLAAVAGIARDAGPGRHRRPLHQDPRTGTSGPSPTGRGWSGHDRELGDVLRRG